MKFFAIIAALGLALVSSVAAQTQCASVAANIPACGQSCIVSAGSAIGCGTNDYSCQCASSSALQASAQDCVISGCGVASALDVVTSAGAVCACVATATPAGGSAGPPASTAAPASSVPTTLITATAAPPAGGYC